MKLEGSCHCGAVTYAVDAQSPSPDTYCYCGICRKTAGAGGFAVYVAANHRTTVVQGREHMRVYRARFQPPGESAQRTSTAERAFCERCGSQLWIWHPEIPDVVYLHASGVDTPLPLPSERMHIMLDSRARWSPLHADPQDSQHPSLPEAFMVALYGKPG
jgi:hypothetical protein